MFLLKPLVVGKLSVFSGMLNDALLHREDLKGQYLTGSVLLARRWPFATPVLCMTSLSLVLN